MDKAKHELLMRVGQAVSDQVIQGMQSNHLLILNPDRFLPLFNCYRELVEGPHAGEVDDLIASHMKSNRPQSMSSMARDLIKQIRSQNQSINDDAGEEPASDLDGDSTLPDLQFLSQNSMDAVKWPSVASLEAKKSSMTANGGRDLGSDAVDYAAQTSNGDSPVQLPDIGNDAESQKPLSTTPLNEVADSEHAAGSFKSEDLLVGGAAKSLSEKLDKQDGVSSAGQVGTSADIAGLASTAVQLSSQSGASEVSDSVSASGHRVEATESQSQRSSSTDDADSDDDLQSTSENSSMNNGIDEILKLGAVSESSEDSADETVAFPTKPSDLADDSANLGSDGINASVPAHQFSDAPSSSDNNDSTSVFDSANKEDVEKPDFGSINTSHIVDTSINDKFGTSDAASDVDSDGESESESVDGSLSDEAKLSGSDNRESEEENADESQSADSLPTVSIDTDEEADDRQSSELVVAASHDALKDLPTAEDASRKSQNNLDSGNGSVPPLSSFTPDEDDDAAKTSDSDDGDDETSLPF